MWVPAGQFALGSDRRSACQKSLSSAYPCERPFRQTTIRGIAVAPRSSFERLNMFLDAHQIKPVIERVYRFDEAVQAFEHLARGPFGKVVIRIADA